METEQELRRRLGAGDLDGVCADLGLPRPLQPGPSCPPTRLVQEANRFKALGKMEEVRGRTLAAEMCFRLAVRFAPGDWEALAGVGRVLAAQQRASEAEQYLRAALWLSKGRVRSELLLVRARLRGRSGRLGAAWRDFKAALRYDPDNEAALRGLDELKVQGLSPFIRFSPLVYAAAAGAVLALVVWGTRLRHLVGG